MSAADLGAVLAALAGPLAEVLRVEGDVLSIGLLEQNTLGTERQWYAAYRRYWMGDVWEELDPHAPLWAEAALREAFEASGYLLEYRSFRGRHTWVLRGEAQEADTSPLALALAVTLVLNTERDLGENQTRGQL